MDNNFYAIDKIEADIISCINKGQSTYDEMCSALPYSEQSIINTLTNLQSKHVLKQTKDKYTYVQPLNSDNFVVLEGNILLPCSVIKIPETKTMYVTRGNWYEFPIDFDVRQIIWNIKFAEKNSSTLADLIKTSVLKERKGKIKHVPEYDNLKNKIVPYTKDIGLLLTSIGETQTSVNVIFRIHMDNAFNTVYNGFTVSTEISTKELIDELSKPVEERNYEKNIQLNKIYSVSDFIFAKNEIPISFEDGKIQYVKITGVRNGYELTYYNFDGITQSSKKIEVEIYDTLSEINEKFKHYFEHYAGQILAASDFYVELDI